MMEAENYYCSVSGARSGSGSGSGSGSVVSNKGVGSAVTLSGAWQSLLCFPHTSSLSLSLSLSQPNTSTNSNTNTNTSTNTNTNHPVSITSQVTHSLEMLLATSELAAARAATRADDIVSIGGRSPSACAIQKVSFSQVLLLALSKIDYYVSGDLVASPCDLAPLFRKVLAQVRKTYRQTYTNAHYYEYDY